MLWTILSILFAIAVIVLIVRLIMGFVDMALSARIINLVAIVVIIGLLIWALRMIFV